MLPILGWAFVTGAIIHNKGGRQAILARRVVDASGDGDISAYVGAPFEIGSPNHAGYNMASSLVMRVGNIDLDAYSEGLKQAKADGQDLWEAKVQEACDKGDFPYMIDRRLNWCVNIPGRDTNRMEQCLCYLHSCNCRCVDGDDLTRQTIEQREQAEWTMNFMKKYLPGYENAWMIECAPMLGVRDSRRILGEYKLTVDDVVENRHFDDAIMRDMHHIDVHHPTNVGHIKHVLREQPDGTKVKVFAIPGTYREVPYGCIVAKKIDNQLVAGRCFSSDFLAQATVRLVLACLNMGQAAGTAAALSLRKNVTPRALDAQMLRVRLIEMGIRLDRQPNYGVASVSTKEKLKQEDLLMPEEQHKDRKWVDDESCSLPVRADKELGWLRLQQRGDEEEAKELEEMEKRLRQHQLAGYTETGGDVGSLKE